MSVPEAVATHAGLAMTGVLRAESIREGWSIQDIKDRKLHKRCHRTQRKRATGRQRGNVRPRR
jgi:hypothetical protein